jgi:hypothetical protein
LQNRSPAWGAHALSNVHVASSLIDASWVAGKRFFELHG